MPTARGRQLDPTGPGILAADLPALPDAVHHDPSAGWIDPRAWFDHRERPLEVEIGSGKGTFLVQQAARQPDTNFLGIEYAHEYWAYAADRVRRNHLANVRLLCADAAEFLHWRVPSAVARVIHLYFPDPWPKTRHHKRRMVSGRFLGDAARILQPGGELRIVTDHDAYWAWMEDHFARWCAPREGTLDHGHPSASPRSGPGGQGRGEGSAAAPARSGVSPTPPGVAPPFTRHPFTAPDSAGRGEVVGTNFERKYRREGRPFHAAILRKHPPTD